MAARDNDSRRLRLVDDQQDQPVAIPESGLTAKREAAFATLVVNANQAAVEHTPDQMDAEQLRSLVIAMDTHFRFKKASRAPRGAVAADARRGAAPDMAENRVEGVVGRRPISVPVRQSSRRALRPARVS